MSLTHVYEFYMRHFLFLKWGLNHLERAKTLRLFFSLTIFKLNWPLGMWELKGPTPPMPPLPGNKASRKWWLNKALFSGDPGSALERFQGPPYLPPMTCTSMSKNLKGFQRFYKVGPKRAALKTLLTFHYTDWLIGILILVYYNPHIAGSITPYIIYPKQPGFFSLLSCKYRPITPQKFGFSIIPVSHPPLFSAIYRGQKKSLHLSITS